MSTSENYVESGVAGRAKIKQAQRDKIAKQVEEFERKQKLKKIPKLDKKSARIKP